MIFTIHQNSLLHSMYYPRYGLPLTRCNFVKGRVTKLIRITYGELIGQIVFGDMIHMRNYMNRHPGMNGTYISHFDRIILLLETAHSLHGVDSAKGQQSQYEKQRNADKLQFFALTQSVQHDSSFLVHRIYSTLMIPCQGKLCSNHCHIFPILFPLDATMSIIRCTV